MITTSTTPHSQSTLTVLHIDDNPDFLDLTQTFLQQELPNYEFLTETNPKTALNRITTSDTDIDCIVCDYSMPQMNGIEVLETLRDTHNNMTPFMLFTGEGSEDVAEDTIKYEGTGYMQKETDTEQYKILAERIKTAIDRTHQQHQNESLSKIYTITSNQQLSIVEKINQVLAVARDHIGTDYAMVNRVGKEELRIEHSCGIDDAFQRGMTCPVEKSYCKQVITNDELLAVHDAVEAGWDSEPVFSHFGLSTYIGAKVTIDGNIYGSFCMMSYDGRQQNFTDEDKRFVELVAQWISYELTWKEKTRQLEVKNKYLQEIAAFVSHDLRNPLAVAMGRLDLLETNNPNATLDGVDDIRNSLDRINNIVDDVQDIASEGEFISFAELEDISLRTIAEHAWNGVETNHSTLVVDTDMHISGQTSKLTQLFENIYRNSIDHNDDPVTITIDELDNSDGFYIEDNGTGIPDTLDHDDLFDLGLTTSDDGTGLGLAIVNRISDAHAWNLTATDSSTDSGLRFEIRNVWLPKETDTPQASRSQPAESD